MQKIIIHNVHTALVGERVFFGLTYDNTIQTFVLDEDIKNWLEENIKLRTWYFKRRWTYEIHYRCNMADVVAFLTFINDTDAMSFRLAWSDVL
jgi:hypothetical protein